MVQLCVLCRTITIADLRSAPVQHHSSLAMLKASSSSCTLCKYFWCCLVETCRDESIETHLQGRAYRREGDTDTGIRLQGEFHDLSGKIPEEGIQDSLIWVFSGKSHIDGAAYSTEVFGKLRLYTKPDDHSAKYFPGREIAPCPAAEAATSAMKGWVSRCRRNHRCAADRYAPLPTRLLDLEPMDHGKNPLLVETRGQKGIYISLSYCWGKDQTFKTTKDNYEQFTTHGIDYGQLAQTHKDAITVTRLVEIRYLWIDAFCIIQKLPGELETSNDDFNQEGLRMAEYYGNCLLTILAGSAENSRQGCMQEKRTRIKDILPPVRFEYTRPSLGILDGIKTGHIYAGMTCSHQVGPVERRAWTLQEDILSQRMLIFAEHRIGYKCRMGEVWEDGTANVARWEAKSPFDVTPRMILDASTTAVKDVTAHARMLRQWYILLRNYSRRQRGNPFDKLTAIAGIAQRAHQLISGRYLFGLWESDILRGLLWRTGWFPGDSYPSLPLIRAEAFSVPSWSWASVEGPIITQYGSERKGKRYICPSNTQVEFLDCCKTAENHFDPIRAGMSVDMFKIRIRGVVQPVRCVHGPVAWNGSMNYYRSSERTVNLMSNLSNNSSFIAGVIQSSGHIVAIALPDTDIDLQKEYWCLRLIKQEGLLLQRSKDGIFNRVGVFLAADLEWFENGQEEELTLA